MGKPPLKVIRLKIASSNPMKGLSSENGYRQFACFGTRALFVHARAEPAGAPERCPVRQRSSELEMAFPLSRRSSRGRAAPRRVAPMQQPGTVVSPAEYWTFLCAAAVLAVALAMPKTFNLSSKLAKRPARGAFGTLRSSDEPRVVQHKRAHEPGRGRQADSPWQIPWRGWKDILWRTYQQIGEDRLLAVAAGVVFYGLLALFPALTAIVSLYGLFANAATINDHLTMAAGILPGGAIDIIREQVARLASKGDAKLGFGFILGLGIALWSANAGMKAIIDALNVVYEEKEKRGFVKLNLISLAFTLAAIAALLLALGAVVVLPLLLAWLGFATVTASLVQYARWPVLLVLVIVGLALIYRFGPSRRRRAGNGWASEVCSPRSPGLAAPPCCRGISEASPITMRPMGRLVLRSA